MSDGNDDEITRIRLDIGGQSVEVLSSAGALASAGSAKLTKAEQEVARFVLGGLQNAEIARRRGTSSRTVEKQVAACLRKLGVSSRAELIAQLERR